METTTCKSIKKSLHFESSGETLCIEIQLKDVSPQVSKDTIISMLDTLFEYAKEDMFADYGNRK